MFICLGSKGFITLMQNAGQASSIAILGTGHLTSHSTRQGIVSVKLFIERSNDCQFQ